VRVLRHRVACALGGLLLLPQVYCMIVPTEAWPYTSAPMFAWDVDDDTPRYRLVFIATDADGNERELSFKEDARIVEQQAQRAFFARVYGSADRDSPWGRLDRKGDDEAFHARLEDYLTQLLNQSRRVQKKLKQPQPTTLRLEIHRVAGPWGDGAVHAVAEVERRGGDVAYRSLR
jgi:hypothetical protein